MKAKEEIENKEKEQVIVKEDNMAKEIKAPNPSLGTSLAIIIFLFVCFIAQIIYNGSPDIHMTLLAASIFAVGILLIKGVKFSVIEEGIIGGLKIATISILILMFIGVMIPAWIGAGTIPTLVYYGMKILSPSIFLLAATLICSLSSLCTGSSWGTAATFGVALMGIGSGLGVPAAMTAGCVVTGGLFGDKLSPLSDTVNLSAAACEVDIFAHIKSVFTTTIPAYLISLVAATVLGFIFVDGTIDKHQTNSILDAIESNFNISPVFALISLIPLAIVLVLSAKRVSSLISLAIASVVGLLIAITLQGYGIVEMIGYMNYGFVIDTGNADVNVLMNRGGMQSMMWTISIAILGLSYGGILEKSGVMATLLNSMGRFTKNARNVIISHTFAGFATIMFTASPYASILIPGRMFSPAYKKLGIKGVVASRTCETSGICLDCLLPWSLSGVYYAGVLGVATLKYAPFAFMLWLVPIIAIIYACTGLFVWKEDKSNKIEGKEV